MAKVLILGANGFVGGHLAEEFSNHGYEVIGSDRGEVSRYAVVDRYFIADIQNAEAVDKLIQQTSPDMIVNLAAISSVGLSWSIPQTTFQVNVVGAINILEAIRKHSPESKVLLIGSSEEYAPADIPLSEDATVLANNPYGASKAAQENIAEMYSKHFGLKVYRVRAFNHLGIGQADTFAIPSWCKQIAEIEASGNSGLISVGNLSAERDFSDVRDVVRAYRMLLESEFYGEVFNVGSGIGHKLSDVLETIIGFSNQEIVVTTNTELLRPVDTPSVVCNREKIESRLGWRPEVALSETLHCVYQDYLNKIALV